MGSIIGFLAGKTIFGRMITVPVARFIATVGLFLAVLGACGGVVALYNHHVIGAHEAKQTASNSIADKKADNQAADQRRSDDARLTNESTELNRSTTNAQTDLDRDLAFQHCLRAQQSARAAKRQPPACG
jgi:hypothetical protein